MSEEGYNEPLQMTHQSLVKEREKKVKNGTLKGKHA